MEVYKNVRNNLQTYTPQTSLKENIPALKFPEKSLNTNHYKTHLSTKKTLRTILNP